MKYRFPLATSSWDQSEFDAIQTVIDSNHFTMGEQVAQFESKFAVNFDSNYAVMVNSGSSANLLMIAALFFTNNTDYKLERGDEIIVPAVSWSTTYYPLCQYGLKLKFVDIDLNTLNYDLQALSEAVSDQTRVIMAVNLLGNPNEFGVIEKIISGKNIFLIEDNCESMGAVYNNRKTGTFGVMGTFSCFFSHHISTMEGGVIVTDDEELYQIMLSMRAHGWTRDLPKYNHITGEKSDNAFDESWNFVLPGYNLRPLEMSGAIGIQQLVKLPNIINGRRSNAILFQEKLSDHPQFFIQTEIGESSWFGFALVLRKNSEITREELVSQLVNLGFESRPIVAGNFTNNRVMQFFDFSIVGELSNAKYIDSNGLLIGNHHDPLDEAIEVLAQI